jgi:DNA mismatch repair protein MutL
VVVEGGQAARTRPAGAAEGTTVEVRDLFFNVPARRKFLKSIGTESAHVAEVMLLAALSRPSLSFFMVRDGRVAREWLRVASRGERAAQVFEGERLEPCLGERGPLRFEAHLAAPERARAGAVGLHFLVNGRPVRDRPLARAVAQAYGSVLEPGRYPVGVVYVDLPWEQVDVNVHPQKAEVRFADARGLFDAVTHELHTALARAFSLPALGKSRPWSPRPPPPSSAAYPPPSSVLSSAPMAVASPLGLGSPMALAEPSALSPSLPLDGDDPWQLEAPVPPPRPLVEPRPASEPTMPCPPSGEPTPPLFESPGFYGSLEFLAQVRGTFLVCSGSDGLYVIDQHAAAERVTFHRLRRAFEARAVATQRSLLPEVVELLPAEVIALEENAEEVAALGVELRAVGPNAVAVHAVPALLGRARPERIVRDLVAELGRTAKRPFGQAADLVLATMACHGSIRAGDSLAREEASALLHSLDDIDFAGHCPHGRPVVTRIGYDELERRVGR